MTTTASTVSSESTGTEFREGRPSGAVRYLLGGFALLTFAVSSLLGAVTDWSQVDSAGFVGNHYMQLLLAGFGGAFMVTGIVKSRRRR